MTATTETWPAIVNEAKPQNGLRHGMYNKVSHTVLILRGKDVARISRHGMKQDRSIPRTTVIAKIDFSGHGLLVEEKFTPVVAENAWAKHAGLFENDPVFVKVAERIADRRKAAQEDHNFQ